VFQRTTDVCEVRTGRAGRPGHSALLFSALSLLALSRPAQPLPAADTEPQQTAIAEVVVTGEHEGPRLWKLRRGDHVVWILGTVSPLPKHMVWQSQGVEEILAQSQEVVPGWPSFGIGANPFTAMRLYIQWRRIQKIPDHMELKQVLPAPLYARFEAMKARFAPDDEHLETLRPMLAGERLMEEVLAASGLTLHNEVQRTVLKLAKKRGVAVRQDKLKVEDPVDVLKDVGATPTSSEIACLDAVLTRLETDLGPMQARARAWALGDVDALRKLPHPDDRTACIAAVSGSERVRNLIARASDAWLLEVEDSLAHNRSTLAVQSMDRLLGENGTLAALKRKGYEIEGP
jgi:uncharacterized protein YbaP (TraB family)